jgi:hypothetical protein
MCCAFHNDGPRSIGGLPGRDEVPVVEAGATVKCARDEDSALLGIVAQNAQAVGGDGERPLAYTDAVSQAPLKLADDIAVGG